MLGSMKLKISELSFLGFIFTVFIVIALFSKPSKDTRVPVGSTYKSGPEGAKAFYLLLKDLGFEVERYKFPLTHLQKHLTQGEVMISIDTGSRDASRELSKIINWVQRGNTAIFIGNSPYLENEHIQAQFLHATRHSLESDPEEVIPSAPTPYVSGVKKICVLPLRFECEREDKVVHFQDERGEIITSFKEGEGKIVLISSPYIVSNKGIREANNVFLMTNILFLEAFKNKVYFDEYGHGYSLEKGLFGYFKGTPFAWVFLQCMLVWLCYIYSFGKRFGRPKEIRVARRRSALEYVEAMAEIFKKADAYQVLFQNIYLYYKVLWSRRIRGRVDLENVKMFAAIVSERTGKNKREIITTFKHFEKAMKEKHTSKNKVFYLLEELEKIRKELSYASLRERNA